ncbi:hypothetical protein EPO33_04895 [Patescibacteria group bacterium]|nr:MAG: hypothetical protein EPO33_04895 [Patescibacteria group bacterium]
MHGFTKRCHCGSRTIPFWARAPFDEHAVAQVFCPHCVNQAPPEALDVAVTGVHGWSGVYAIDWNQAALHDRDAKFRDAPAYYEKLFKKDLVTFGFLPRIRAEGAYTLLGIRGFVPSESAPLSAKSKKALKNEERAG